MMNISGVEWVVLSIHPSVLWLKDCAFCIENAASNSVRFIPIDQRKGRRAFSQLFENREGWPQREDTGIPMNYTTNPQAEVLVFDVIEPNFIQSVNFKNIHRYNEFKLQYPNINSMLDRSVFDARFDYAAW